MEKYDLCVIGGGPAGYAAAMRAIDFGKKVVLIEKDKIGGAGIYNGALTSKTLWELSEKVAAVNENIVHADSKRYDITWEDVQKVSVFITHEVAKNRNIKQVVLLRKRFRKFYK
jgi:dihydrolipoamide dehydrogenase